MSRLRQDLLTMIMSDDVPTLCQLSAAFLPYMPMPSPIRIYS
jgi:hypothetical protein